MTAGTSSSRLLRSICTAASRAHPPLLAPRPAWPRPCRTVPITPRAFRSFATTTARRATLASHSPGKDAELVYIPTKESLLELEEDAEESDIDLVPPEEAKLEITDEAAKQLQSVAAVNADPTAGLRITVESGGCHGYQYKLKFVRGRNPDDYHFEHPTIKPSNIVVDAVSMSLLKGSTIDFVTELIGSSFRVAENPQAKGNGCGCGVSWELKI